MPTFYNVGDVDVNHLDTTEPICQVAIFNGYSEYRFYDLTQDSLLLSGGTRKKITRFSPRSRKNLLKQLFSLSAYPNLFCTLTYPKIYPASSDEWKRHLDNFTRELRRQFKKAWFFWKLEPQKRGAPHYHLIGDLGEPISIVLFRKWLAEIWYRVCGTNNIKHLQAGTQADYLTDSLGKIKSYVCKYVAKVDLAENYPEWANPGRFWGKIGERNMPAKLVNIVQLSFNEYKILKRFLRRWIKRFSHSSRRYSKRLKNIPSYNLLSDHKAVSKLIEFITDTSLPPPVPVHEVPTVTYHSPIYN